MGLETELMILAIGRKGRPHFSPELAYSLAAAELLEQDATGRIGRRSNRAAGFQAPTKTPTKAATANGMSASIDMSAMHALVPKWLEARGPWRIDKYVDELAAADVIGVSTSSTGTAEPARTITIHDAERFDAAERRLLDACEPGSEPSVDDLVFAVLADVGKCADAPLSGWGNRARRARMGALVRSVEGREERALQVLALCMAEIPQLARRAPKNPGDGRTIDEQIGLTREGRNAALYWGH